MISDLFYKLKDIIPNTITLGTHTIRKVEPINENSTLGEQIKYFRRLADIKQTDLSLKLGYSRDALHHIENREMKLLDINLIKAVIEELDIADKIRINDDYITFLLDNPHEKIRAMRKNANLSIRKFADMIGVNPTSVKRWEYGKSNISRKQFDIFKKCMS